MNLEELKDWNDDARRELEREAEHLREKEEQIGGCLHILEATDELLAEIGRLQARLDESQSEAERLREQLEAIQAQPSRPTEIHNHFESGSSAQVFNSKVNGKFKEKKKWRRIRKGA